MEMEKREIDTPALVIDLDLVEKNLKTLADFLRGKKAVARPHFKTPKTPIVAWRQIDLGAKGVCAQKLGEVEVLANAGVRDILLTNEIAGETKIKRLVNMVRHSPDLKVCVDSLENASAISTAASNAGLKTGVLVELRVGGRCGIQPREPAVELAKEVNKLKGLEFKGIQAYAGPLNLIDQREGMEKKLSGCREVNEAVAATRDLMTDAGLNVEIVSGAGTGTYRLQHEYYTEVQPGSYVFMDWRYKISAPEFENALTVLSTVVSKPQADQAIIDSGWKTMSADGGPAKVKERDDIKYEFSGDEHGRLTLPRSSDAKIGEKVELIPSHVCTTVNLYDKLFACRKDTVEAVWKIAARGRSQ